MIQLNLINLLECLPTAKSLWQAKANKLIYMKLKNWKFN